MSAKNPRGSLRLPPLESLRFFLVAGRHESFAKAARELGVTPSAVAHRIKLLENDLEAKLFERHAHGLNLSPLGTAYLIEVQRILVTVHNATERCRKGTKANVLRLVAVHALAEMWLMPRLAQFHAAHPDVAIELETDHREVDPLRRTFDVWMAFTSETKRTLETEVLSEETLVPVCSPAFLASQGRPSRPSELHRFPLLYDLTWHDYWEWWFARQGAEPPDLSKASGFRLYSLIIQAAVNGMGVALGHSMLIASELQCGSLVRLFDLPVTAPARYLLVTASGSERKPAVQAFRNWIRHLVTSADDSTDSVPSSSQAHRKLREDGAEFEAAAEQSEQPI